jgi:hypothetical protein
MIKANNTRSDVSFPVMPSAENFLYRVAFSKIWCIVNYSKLFWTENCELINSSWFQDGDFLVLYKVCENPVGFIVNNAGITSKKSCKIDDQSKSLTKRAGGTEEWHCYTVLNWQQRSENTNVWLKLYRKILSKYKYTSLELAVRWPVFRANPLANYRTSNPVRVGRNGNKKEQCHRLWQCQTIVDS